MASSALHFFFLSIALFSVSSLSLSDEPKTNSRPFILPIKKDPSTNLFYTSVGIGTPQHKMDLVIDLAGPSLWYDCNSHYNSSSYHPVPCDSQKCPKISACTGCNGPFKPGCTNNTCGLDILNPLAKFIFGGDLGEDVLYMPHIQVPGFLSGCTGSDSFTGDAVLLQGLPKGSEGIIGFARTEFAVQAQISSAYKLPLKFSLCLPSSTKKGFGDIFIGAGKYPQDVSKFLRTTPLVVNPISTGPVSVSGVPSYEYFIDVKSVKIDGEAVNLKPSLLSIDNKGNGGTKISTMTPFTELHSSVYKSFVRHFIKKAADRKMKKVASVPPFEACYDSRTISNSVSGLTVPTIDLVLQGGVQWTIYGANSMVMAKENVACLGFVDGGTEPRMSFVKASIVIGGYQLEDNLLIFDLASSKLTFSSSLLPRHTSCSHF